MWFVAFLLLMAAFLSILYILGPCYYGSGSGGQGGAGGSGGGGGGE